MHDRTPIVCLAIAASLLAPNVASAGMPSISLSDVASMRLESLSFFLLVFLLGARGIQALWNGLTTDFPRLPRLTYRKALGLTTLWGLLFIVVLAMVSGARELLTPGAWEKTGLTYKLATRKPVAAAEPSYTSEAARRQKLEQLRLMLWTYAAGHNGKLPASDNDPAVAEEFWQTTDPSGVRYIFSGGKALHAGNEIVALEPQVFGDDPFALFTTGAIRRLSAEELRALRAKEQR